MVKQSSSPKRVSRAIDKNINFAQRDLKTAFAFVAKTRANIWLTAAAVLFVLGFGIAAIIIPPPGTEAAFNFARRATTPIRGTTTSTNPIANNNCTPIGDFQPESEDVVAGSNSLVSSGLNLSPMLAPVISGSHSVALGSEASLNVKAQFENSACLGNVGIRFRINWGDGTSSTYLTSKPTETTTIKHRYLLGSGDLSMSVTSEYMAAVSTANTASVSPPSQFAITITEASGGGPISAVIKNPSTALANINRGETKEFTEIELTANQNVTINGIAVLGDWTVVETRLYRPPFDKFFQVSGSINGAAYAQYNPRIGTTTYNGFVGLVKLNGKAVNPAVSASGTPFSMTAGSKATIKLKGTILSGANPCDIVKLGLGFLYADAGTIVYGGPLWGPSYQIEQTAAAGRCATLGTGQSSSASSGSPTTTPTNTSKTTTSKVTPKGTATTTPKK